MIKTVILSLISVYQRILSPLKPATCRFYPSCSEYLRETIQIQSVPKGLFLGMTRLLKCHPFHPGGIDLVRAKS